MIYSKTLIACFLASVALCDINQDYESVIHGQEPLKESHIEEIYEQFTREFSDRPGVEMNGDRKKVFTESLKSIIEHNSDKSQTWKKGISPFTDMTEEEFFQYFNIVNAPQNCSATHNQRVEKNFKLEEIPTYWDWRDVNGVTPVKNQGSCGSCWTFSTIGAVESHYLIKYNQFQNLSEQQLVDCAGAYDNHGCSGGLPSHAFEYFTDVGGIATEQNYVYTAKDGTCKFKLDLAAVKVTGGSVNITAGDEVEL